MKIAIPIWEQKVSPVFDTASRLMVLHMENQDERSRFEMDLDEQELSQRCLRILGLGVDVLICGAISKQFYRMLMASGIRIIPWISGTAEEVIRAYLEGNLLNPNFLMPGYDPYKMDGDSDLLSSSLAERERGWGSETSMGNRKETTRDKKEG